MQLSALTTINFCLQTTLTVVEVLWWRSPFRSPPSRRIHRKLTQIRCRTVDVHRRWYRSLCASTTLAAESAHARISSYSFSLTAAIFLSIIRHFARIQSSRSHYFTSTNHLLCGFYLNFLLKACFKSLQAHPTSCWLVHGRVTHTPRLIAMHVVFRSFLKIFEYASKQACKYAAAVQ